MTFGTVRDIRIWDPETGSAVGQPLNGHIDQVLSLALSLDGHHIVSGSRDGTIQIGEINFGCVSGKLLKSHADYLQSVPYSPDCSIDCSVSGPIRPASTHNQISPDFHALPDSEGWVRDSEGGLLYWVPFDCRQGLRSSSLLTIPQTSCIRSVSLDFTHFVFGTSWTNVFRVVQS